MYKWWLKRFSFLLMMTVSLIGIGCTFEALAADGQIEAAYKLGAGDQVRVIVLVKRIYQASLR